MSGLGIQMSRFFGFPKDRGDVWLRDFRHFCTINRIGDQWLPTVKFYLEGHARTWYDALNDTVKTSADDFTTEFTTRFNGNDGIQTGIPIVSLKQMHKESCYDYFTRVYEAANQSTLPQDFIVSMAIQGLQPHLQAAVLMHGCTTLEDVRQKATLAERGSQAVVSEQGNVATLDIDSITTKVAQTVIAALAPRLQQEHEEPVPPPTYARRFQRERQSYNSNNQTTHTCRRCGGRNCFDFLTCAARGKTCLRCNRKNHFSETCRTNLNNLQ